MCVLEADQERVWDYDVCERCGDFATHRLYWGEELLHHYCCGCMNIVEGEHEALLLEVAAICATLAS